MTRLALMSSGRALWATGRTVARRELRTVVRNRFLQIFSLLMLGVGLLTPTLSGSVRSVPFVLLQLVLYLVPLFALMLGVGAAHEELDERDFLFSQPVFRAAIIAGQWLALWTSLSLALVLAVLPGLLTGGAPGPLIGLWLYGVMLISLCTSLGLWVGYGTRDRARGVIYGLLVWFGLLVLYDGAALLLSGWGPIRRLPQLWVGLLMLNPLDVVRIAALSRLETVPFTTPEGGTLLHGWLEHLDLWLVTLSALWTGVPLWHTWWRLDRTDI